MHTAVIGGGIIGLAVARELAGRGHQVTVLEKETGWARHQTGRNSGVIHAGLYYKPGSLKAALCTAGAESMVRFAREQGVRVEVRGIAGTGTGTGIRVTTTRGEIRADALVNCAGLQCDRVARLAGLEPPAR